MVSRRVAIFLLLSIIYNNFSPAESGVIIKKIKSTVENIKNYFRGNNEESGDSEEPNLMDNVETKTTPSYPKIDIRGHEDFDVETTTNIIPTLSSRRLIDVGCPQGTRLDRSNNCRPI